MHIIVGTSSAVVILDVDPWAVSVDIDLKRMWLEEGLGTSDYYCPECKLGLILNYLIQKLCAKLEIRKRTVRLALCVAVWREFTFQSSFCKCGYYGMESRHTMNGNDTQALDEKQNEVITPASNELAQRKADLEVNLNLLNELKLKTSSVSYFSGLPNEPGKGGKQAPVQFVNISDLQVDNTWSEGIFFSKATEGLKENLEEEKLDAEMDIFKEEYAEETGFDEKQDYVVLVTEMDTFGEEEAAYAQLSPQETFEKGEEQTLSDSVKSADESESEFSQIQRESIDNKQLDEQNIVDQSKSGLKALLDVATDPASSASTDTIFLDHKSESDVNTRSEEGVQSSSEDNSFAHRAAMRVSSLFAAVLAAAAYTYHYKRKQQPCSAPLLRKENWQAGTKQHYNSPTKKRRSIHRVGKQRLMRLVVNHALHQK
ncbi:hypothetical protein ACS0TY_013920 [Phlomoides rotata]